MPDLVWVDGVTPVNAENLTKTQRRTATITVGAVDAESPDSYDYTCDGVADQSTISDAVTALPAGGGTVILSEGTFTFSSSLVIDKANTTLQGQGASTLITIGSAVNLAVIDLGNATGTSAGMCVRDLRIDGNSANQSTSAANGIRVRSDATHALIENVTLEDVYNNPVQLATSYATVRGCYITHDKLTAAIFSDNGSGPNLVNGNRIILGANSRDGIWLAEIGDIASENTVISTSTQTFTQGSNPGLIVAFASKNTVANNYVQWNSASGGDDGACISITSQSTASGNTVRLQGARSTIGIHVGSNQNTIAGNSVTNDGTGTTSIGIGGELIIGSVISGNQINDFPYGIRTYWTSGVLISGNYIEECDYGFYGEGSNAFLHITGNQFQPASTNIIAIYVPNGFDRGVISDNLIYDYNQHAIQLGGARYCTITGNVIADCGNATNDTYSAILLQYGTDASRYSTYNTITGNTISSTVTNKHKYGVREDTATDGPNIVSSNIILNSVTTAVSTQHGSSVSANNITS